MCYINRFFNNRAVVIGVVLWVVHFAHAHAETLPARYIALHAAPHEVAPIVMTLPIDDPLLDECAPVLIPSSDHTMPPLQNPWQWLEVSGVFTGYIALTQMDDSNRPIQSAAILSAPDLDSPLLISADMVADSIRLVALNEPFAKIVFTATLPLFVDEDATPLTESMVMPMRPDDSDKVTALIETPVAAPATIGMETLPRAEMVAGTDPATAIASVKSEPSPIVRMLAGRLVSARDAGFRRAPFQYVVVSTAGRPLAFADMQHFRSAPLSSIIGKEGVFSGAVLASNDPQLALPVMQVRTFRGY
jgi:hypothetical protein